MKTLAKLLSALFFIITFFAFVAILCTGTATMGEPTGSPEQNIQEDIFFAVLFLTIVISTPVAIALDIYSLKPD